VPGVSTWCHCFATTATDAIVTVLPFAAVWEIGVKAIHLPFIG
jgi:hypothetical protein